MTHYSVTVFGVKDTSENIIEFIRRELCPVDLVVTIAPKVLEHNEVSGFKGLSVLRLQGINGPVFLSGAAVHDREGKGFGAQIDPAPAKVV